MTSLYVCFSCIDLEGKCINSNYVGKFNENFKVKSDNINNDKPSHV